ncbi:nitroreductase family protein [Bosea sp. 685]|uniref:nitroreductase family protein n=1 Tax=Bosea sp. 685 TaxID=3080057 RepID=UPI0028932810|nr:nitroreductase family protein [Bosea sp. 685]WNJ92194.1 nitroreductase family protein [Bosea sp. 685]
MNDRAAVTEYPIDPALAGRWSPRAFASSTIDEAAVASLFEAARWAPSANNLQPWAFIHASRGTENFDRLHSCLKEANAIWAGSAALLVLALARPIKPDGNTNLHARYDLGQAVAYMTFQATALGLHVHQMGGFDTDRARTVMGIPIDHEAVTAIAIGRRGEPSSLPAPLQDRECAPRTRKSTKTFVFPGRWQEQDGRE